jgi:hypothetical protein
MLGYEENVVEGQRDFLADTRRSILGLGAL